MKKILALILVVGILFISAIALADEFNVAVTIPKANSANFIVFKITDPDNFPTTPITGNNLTFTTTFDSEFNTFLGNEYYAINVQPIGGAGGVNLKLNYVDVAKPAGQTTGLGGRSTATVVGVASNNTETGLLLKSLAESNNQTVLASSLPEGQYMRVYVALANGKEATSVNVAPFNTGDKPGDYIGTLTLTALQP